MSHIMSCSSFSKVCPQVELITLDLIYHTTNLSYISSYIFVYSASRWSWCLLRSLTRKLENGRWWRRCTEKGNTRHPTSQDYKWLSMSMSLSLYLCVPSLLLTFSMVKKENSTLLWRLWIENIIYSFTMWQGHLMLCHLSAETSRYWK